VSFKKFLFLPLALFLFSAGLFGASVSLSWNANTETDLAGYWVYRTKTSGTSYARVNTSLLTTTSFTDSSVSSGTTYYYTVSAVNKTGQESPKSAEVTATVPTSTSTTNSPPVANAGPDQTVASGASVTLKGSGTDADGDALTYSWKQISGTTVTLSGATTATASFTAPTVSSNTTLTFRLTVSDGKGGTGTDDVNVVVTSSTSSTTNNPPVVDAGPDRYVLSGSTVTCEGSAYDPDGDPMTFAWHQVSGPTVSMSGTTTLTMSFVAPKVTSDTSMKFRLWARDNRNGETRDDVAIKVTTNSSLVSPASLTTSDTSLSSTFIGVAILNPSMGSSTVEISAVDENGSEELLDTTVFGAQVQQAFLTESLAADLKNVVSIRAQGEDEKLRGFFLVGDGPPDRLDGVGGTPDAATRLYFPAAKSDAQEKTIVFLSNPDQTVAANVTLNVVGSQGAVVRTAALQLAAGASRLASLADLIGSAALTGEHYLEAVADAPIQGFQLIADPKTFSSIAGRSANRVRTLWIPHYVLGHNGEDTELRLINAESEAVRAILNFHDDSARLVGTREILVPASGVAVQKLSELLGNGLIPQGVPFLTGHIVAEITASSSQRPVSVVGTASFTTERGNAKSTLPALHEPQKETLFLHVAQSIREDIFTGLAVMNPNNTRATVTVQVLNEDGQIVVEKSLQIEPGQRVVDLLNGARLFGAAFQQIGGHIKLTSDHPVVSFVMFGDGSRYLSAVEGQVPAR
jgi:hypothetical protein